MSRPTVDEESTSVGSKSCSQIVGGKLDLGPKSNPYVATGRATVGLGLLSMGPKPNEVAMIGCGS